VILDNAPVTMFFAIFEAPGHSQEHVAIVYQ
jgi:hypothetical protein